MGSFVSPALRSRVRSGLEPIARLLGRAGLTPNALTLIGFAIAVVAAYAAATQAWLVAGLLVAFGAVFDLFDGALARATGTTSRFGAFMDSTFDRAGEAVVYVGIAGGLMAAASPSAAPDELIRLRGSIVYTDLGALVAIFAMSAAFMVSYVRAKSESIGFTPGSGMANVGLAPREVRTVLLTFGLLAAGTSAAIPTSSEPGDLLGGTEQWWYLLVGSLALIAVLATVTTIQRIYHVYQQAKKER